MSLNKVALPVSPLYGRQQPAKLGYLIFVAI
jgi:hypothetical protein